jgi:hypothetical protein
MPINRIGLDYRIHAAAPLAVAFAGLCLLGSGALLFGQAIPQPPRHPAGGRLVLIPPGTVIPAEGVPRGWTHFILKSEPRIRPQHRHLVTNQVIQLSSLLTTATLARVEPVEENGEVHYRLGDLGLGLATRIRGTETVITPDTHSRLGAGFGFFESTLLGECFEKVKMARLRARTETMALLDTHAVMIRGGRHRESVTRHAILIDPKSGRLETLVWGIDLDANRNYLGVSSHMEWLRPGTVEDCQLWVDPNAFTLGIPSDLAFAVPGPPKGRLTVPFTSDLVTVAGQSRFTPQSLQTFESGLRQALWAAAQQNARQPLAAGHGGR